MKQNNHMGPYNGILLNNKKKKLLIHSEIHLNPKKHMLCLKTLDSICMNYLEKANGDRK